MFVSFKQSSHGIVLKFCLELDFKKLAMETLTMEKITDDTLFFFYYSEEAFKAKGGRKVNGIIYTEKVMKGRSPFLKYSDRKIVAWGKNIDMKIERI